MSVKAIKHELNRLSHGFKSERGFSLLEMVVAMGILIVLTVGGVLAYNGINQNAKEGATLAAAKSVHTAALAYDVDNDAATAYTDAADEYNNSQEKGEGDSSTLVTQVNRLDDGSLCSVATYGEDEIVEVVGAGNAKDCVDGTIPEEVVIPTDFVVADENGSYLMYAKDILNWTNETPNKCYIEQINTGLEFQYKMNNGYELHDECSIGTYLQTHPGQDYKVRIQSMTPNFTQTNSGSLEAEFQFKTDGIDTLNNEWLDLPNYNVQFSEHFFKAKEEFTKINLSSKLTEYNTTKNPKQYFYHVHVTPVN